jgi:preprotein translocase SecE subunit
VEREGRHNGEDDEVLGDDEVFESEDELVDAQEAADAEVGSASPARGAQAVPGASTKEQSGPRFFNFVKACWAELQRVQWPDRSQVGQGTAVVLGFVVLAGAYLGLADVVAQEIVDFIL